MNKKIVAITSSRADYSHLYWPLKLLEQDKSIDLTILCFGPHLSPEYGETWQQIQRDGFTQLKTLECLLSSDTDVGMAKSLGLAILGITDILAELRPDLMLIIADRYEMLAAANVALTLRIPIAHIEGGDVSEGAIDDAVRNALTKMSHVHFTPTDKAKKRVLAMGEESWRVHLSGAPSLDHLRKSTIPKRDKISSQFNLDHKKLIVAAYHPVTMYQDSVKEQHELFKALSTRSENIIFCFPNADTGSHKIMQKASDFCQQYTNAQIHTNLPAQTYWGLLKQADLMLGNSSSGIMETASLKLPCINIGIRQQGREQAVNIIDVKADNKLIIEAIEQALSPEFKDSLKGLINPYGDGFAAEKIVAVLRELEINDKLLFKKNIL
ncbi:MAG: UDP-N-acetylglucosamine 2-epimerase (hydrolyzing) [Alcanivoracaceae bacterium]|nr:UDP-N-acetylglucosamine 2-epimerase (hydrolyzing) [Alcanivoracaceae bacterium]